MNKMIYHELSHEISHMNQLRISYENPIRKIPGFLGENSPVSHGFYRLGPTTATRRANLKDTLQKNTKNLSW